MSLRTNHLIWPRPRHPEEDNCIKNPHYMHVYVSTYVLINSLHDVLLLRLVYNFHFRLPSQSSTGNCCWLNKWFSECVVAVKESLQDPSPLSTRSAEQQTWEKTLTISMAEVITKPLLIKTKVLHKLIVKERHAHVTYRNDKGNMILLLLEVCTDMVASL